MLSPTESLATVNWDARIESRMDDFSCTDFRLREILSVSSPVPTIPPTDAAEANFVRGMKEIYQGPIVVGRDGMTIEVP